MSNVIKTIVPIPVDTLREIIGDPDIELIVDLSESTVAPLQAMIYLSNLDLTVDVVFNDEDRLKVLDAYLKLPTLLKCPALETLVIQLVLHLKGIVPVDFFPSEWTEERREIITKWVSLIDSLIIYIPSIVEDDEMKAVLNAAPVDETNDMVGINFVNLFENPLFPLTLEHTSDHLIRNYVKYFNDYMYKGHNLYSFWASPDNSLHTFMMSMIDDTVATDEEFSEFVSSLSEEVKEAT